MTDEAKAANDAPPAVPGAVPVELSDAEKQHADQLMQALFNHTCMNVFHLQAQLPQPAQHLPLFAAARALGELVGLFFKEGDKLLADLNKTMTSKAGEITLMTDDARNIKIQALIDAVRRATAPKPKLALPKHMRH